MMVLDASVAMAWCIDDEATPDLDALLVLAQELGIWVPGLWHLEVANAMKVAVRKRRLARERMASSLALLALANLHVDEDTARCAWGPTLALSDRHGLTLYDAAYLELALRRRLPLASLDVDLRAAAADEGVIALPG
jgi:predicted nucleic acid-binding protein